MTDIIPHFIVVDDDPINNIICAKIIKNVYPEAQVLTFNDPGIAITYIASTYESATALDAVLFLDINMPIISGWDFLDAFEQFDIKIKSRIRIYMLTSSFDTSDRQRADENINVAGYFEKPLTRDKIKSIEMVVIDDKYKVLEDAHGK